MIRDACDPATGNGRPPRIGTRVRHLPVERHPYFTEDGTQTVDPTKDVCGKHMSDCLLQLAERSIAVSWIPGVREISHEKRLNPCHCPPISWWRCSRTVISMPRSKCTLEIYPNECCGILTPNGYVKLTNVAPDARIPQLHGGTHTLSDRREVIAFVHSHPDSPHAPSAST